MLLIPHRYGSDYKIDRKPVEESLKWQLGHLARVTRALGIQPLTAQGFEADDVIGTLARAASAPSPSVGGGSGCAPFDRVVILSADKDFIQCLNPRVSILSPKSKSVGGGGGSVGGGSACYVYMHHADVIEAVGVPAERFVDFLVLLGDASDGIPGVDGIGAVRAKQILTHYGSIDDALRDFKSHTRTHNSGHGIWALRPSRVNSVSHFSFVALSVCAAFLRSRKKFGAAKGKVSSKILASLSAAEKVRIGAGPGPDGLEWI